MKLLSLLLFLALTSACGDTIVNNPAAPSAPVPPPQPNRVEFRVTGNATNVRIRFSNTVDGLSQVNTGLPYFVQFNTTITQMFLYIDATPQAYPFILTSPFLSAQIVVNGSLFREATSNDFTFNTISASGTWRQ